MSKELIAEVTGTDVASIADNMPIAELPGWDSLKMVRLVVRLEELRNSELTEEEIESLVTVADLARLLEGRA
jgi:acyl carrier protein